MPYYPERKQEPPENPSRDQERRRERRMRVLRIGIAMLSVALIGYGAFRLIQYGVEYFASRRTSEELLRFATATNTPLPTREIALETMVMPDATETPEAIVETAEAEPTTEVLQQGEYPNNPQLLISDRFLQLRKKSKYIIGWLSMDALEEAVAQRDNTWFLTHDALGNKNSNGAIFLDAEISLYRRPVTYILYGHNMKSGNMFGRLQKYKDNSYLVRHRIITFDTMYEDGKFAVFSVATISVTPGESRYINLTALQSTDRSTRKQELETLIKKSALTLPLDVNEEDQLLLLVTCTGDDNERLIVAARRLRSEESEDVLVYQ